MVFSFFQKKKEPAAAEQPAVAQPRIVRPAGATPPPKPEAAAKVPAAGPADFTTSGPSTLSAVRIEVSESTEHLSEAVEQAAICYANNQIDDAIVILAAEVKAQGGHCGIDTWLMLFDLYQLRNRKAEFDELALQFVVVFERTAPLWQAGANSGKPMPAKAGGPNFLFARQLQASSIEGQLDQLELLAQDKQPVRVDFSCIEQIESAAAGAIVARLAKLRKKKARLQAAGTAGVIGRLKALIEPMRKIDDEAPFWLLLLDVYQLLGLQEDFDTTAIDYAVTYELSPPSWESAAYGPPPKPGSLKEVPTLTEEVVEAFRPQGAMLDISEADLQPLLAYAEQHHSVRIDLSQVPRIDFVSAGMLLNVLVQLTAQGKRLVIMGANELIIALFRIMGIADIAQIIRRK